MPRRHSRNSPGLTVFGRTVSAPILTGLLWLYPALLLSAGLHWFVDLFSHFVVHVATIYILLIPLWWVAFGRVSWTLLITASLLAGYVAMTVDFSDRVVQPRGLKVLSWNVYYANETVARVVDHINDSDADVVYLAETTPSWRRALAATETVFPFRVFASECDAVGCEVALLSRRPLRNVRVEKYAYDTPPVILADIDADVPGGRLTLVGLHLRKAVGPRGARRQAAQLETLGNRVRALDGPVAMFGDMNATPYSAVFRRLASRTGLEPLTRTMRPSWPARAGPFGIPINHVFVSPDLDVSYTYGPSLGSDHRALVLFVGPAETNDAARTAGTGKIGAPAD